MLFTILFLSVVGAVGALLLFTVAKKFHVEEDPRIGEVQDALPGANCGGCGYPGCGGFASACVASESLDGLFCPVGGNETMSRVASILGREASAAEPLVAVVRCNGNCEDRPRTNTYDGATSCKIATSLYGGETGCTYGCHGLGDCTVVCNFDAIHINPVTKLPEVDEDKCTACGACVKACPKFIIELRKKGPKGRRVFVSCVNKDKGGLATKACKNACIGCSKCLKECNFEAITIENNLSYIDHTKCRLCRKCVAVCPTNAIHEIGFPPRKEKPAETEVKENAATPVATPPATPEATQPLA